LRTLTQTRVRRACHGQGFDQPAGPVEPEIDERVVPGRRGQALAAGDSLAGGHGRLNFVGIGEKLADLQTFRAREFAEALVR
jgi:hypothetical protein